MAKTTAKTTATKAKLPKRAAGKSGKKTATAAASRNGAQNDRLSEKTKQITLHAFQLAYQQHALQAAAAQTQTDQPVTGEPAHETATTKARRNGARPKRKQPTIEEITLKAFRKVYESHHPKTA